jgi:hypothetical protein
MADGARNFRKADDDGSLSPRERVRVRGNGTSEFTNN